MSFRRITPILGLVLASLCIWCAVTHRWSWQTWQTPLQLHGDPLEIYTRVKIASEDLTQPLSGFSSVPRLAAPIGANWSRYPISDRVTFTFIGLLARAVGVFTAVNIAIAAVHMLNAIVFYVCARFLRWRREWALATALLFAFSGYNFRWGVTISFSLSFVIPPLLLLCGWIARPAPAVRSRNWTWLAAGLAAWLGGANPYFVFFGSQLVAWSVVLQLFRRREFARCRAGAVFLAIVVASFALHNAPYFLAPTEGSSRLTLDRNYAGSEIYALKPIDLIIPPADHRVAFAGEIGGSYWAQSALRTEFFINYLGIAGLIGLALIFSRAASPLFRGTRARVPDAALGVVWTLLFSAVGGVNSVLALAGLDIFRASNRNGIFILVWALWFFGRWCQRRWPAQTPLLRYSLPMAVVVLGLTDSIPRLNADRNLRDNAASLRTHEQLLDVVEAKLGHDALVFQLPSPPFPEAGKSINLDDYEQFLPYLTSHTLRFSYGSLRGTNASRALRALGRVPAPMMKEQLEKSGFKAIWIDRRGLIGSGKMVINGLRSLGLEEFAQTALPHVVIFLLHPSDHPHALDLTDPALFEPWDVILSLTKPTIVTFDGWYDLEHDDERAWRWAQHEASTGLMIPTAGRVELSFWAHSLTRGDLVLELDGREIWRYVVTPQSREQRVLAFDVTAGRHRLGWRFTGPLMRPTTPDGRTLGFAIENLLLSAGAK